MSIDTEKPKISRLPRPGEVIDGRYRLEKTFASGGMGVIMRAEQLRTGRDVAVKLLHPHIASRPDFAARFMREVKVATLFDHPHIVRVYDVGETEAGGLYLVMELLEGEELKDIIKREAPLSTGRVMELGLQILDGLGEAHSREVVHRDLKPANVFVTTNRRGQETAKLLDFGIAKLVNSGDMQVTATGSFTGTPSYMAPETMFEVEGINRMAADVYAAGLLLLEMLTGRRAFDGKILAQTLLQHLKKPVLIPAAIADTPLGEVVRKATAKHPDDRYTDCDEMFNALEKARPQTPKDIQLGPRQIPGPAPATSPSLLEKIGQQDPEKSLAMLRNIPQSEVVGSRARRSSDAGIPHPTDTPTEAPSTTEQKSPPKPTTPNTDSTIELSDEHIVTVTDDTSSAEIEDFEVGPTEIRVPDALSDLDIQEGPPIDGPTEEATSTDTPLTFEDDFDVEPTKVERPQISIDDGDFEYESTKVERPSGMPGDDSPPPPSFSPPTDEPLPTPEDVEAPPATTKPLSTTVDRGETPDTPMDIEEVEEAASATIADDPTPVPAPSPVSQPSSDESPDTSTTSLKPTLLIAIAGSIIVLIAGVGVIAFLFVGDDDEPKTSVDDDEPVAAAVAEEALAAEEDPAEVDQTPPPDHEEPSAQDEKEKDTTVQLDLDSEPSGAQVYADDEKLGATELNLAFEKKEAPLNFRFKKEGYEEKVVEWNDDDTELVVTLEEEKVEEPQPAPTPPPSHPVPDTEEEKEDSRDIDSVVNEHLFQ